MKKAQGLSLGYVVVGIIAVVVLVVIILIFTGGMNNVINPVENISNQKCQTPTSGCTWKLKSECTGTVKEGVFTDLQVGKVCCCD